MTPYVYVSDYELVVELAKNGPLAISFIRNVTEPHEMLRKLVHILKIMLFGC